MILGLHHTALCTSNLQNTLSFYCDILGAELCESGGWEPGFDALDAMVGLKRSAARYAMVRLGNAYLEIFEFSAPQPESIKRRACDLGIAHLCLQVRDIESEVERLRAAGARFDEPVQHLGKASAFIYGYDPDGNMMELVELPSSGGIVPSNYD